jgi:hypothetical protein
MALEGWLVFGVAVGAPVWLLVEEIASRLRDVPGLAVEAARRRTRGPLGSVAVAQRDAA